MGSAAIGGIVIMLQQKLLRLTQMSPLQIGCICFSIALSLIAKERLVKTLSAGKTIYDMSKSLGVLRNTITIFMFFGIGFFCGQFKFGL